MCLIQIQAQNSTAPLNNQTNFEEHKNKQKEAVKEHLESALDILEASEDLLGYLAGKKGEKEAESHKKISKKSEKEQNEMLLRA